MTPDEFLLAGFAAALVVLLIGNSGGSRPTVETDAIRVGSIVEVLAGPHRGLCGFVRSICVDPSSGAITVRMQVQGLAAWLRVERENVALVNGN